MNRLLQKQGSSIKIIEGQTKELEERYRTAKRNNVDANTLLRLKTRISLL